MSTRPGPSLWRDAALSYFIQLVKSVKLHLYCTEVHDALDLRVREETGQLDHETEDDVRDANRRARMSTLASLCSRALRYALCIGEYQDEESPRVDDFVEKLQEQHRMELLALGGDDDAVHEEGPAAGASTALGVFANPAHACSLLAEVR